MKKVLGLILMSTMLSCLIGCNSNQMPSTTITTKPTQLPAPEDSHPTVSGTFMQPWAFAGYDVQRMTAHLQNLKDVGIDLLILQNTFHYNGKVTKTFFKDSFSEDQLADTYNRDAVSFMDVVLTAAKNCDMQVYIGLTSDDDWWKKIFTDEAWLNDHVNISLQAARQIYDGYKDSYPNTLTGWYFWPEYWNMDCTADETTLAVSFLSNYRDGLYAIDNSMPMLLSPYITSAVDAAKTQDFWTNILSASALRDGDIFCCQDSVGAGHVTLDQIDGYFAAMKAAADTNPGLLFWANNEDFTPEFKSADMGRFKRQLEITGKYADTHISFAFCHYRNPDMGKTKAYEAYKHYYETGELIKEMAASPAVTVESVNQGFYVNFDVTVDNSKGDVYAVFITKDGEVVYKQFFDTDTDAATPTLKATYTDLNMNVGPIQRIYTVFTVDYYGNVSEENMEKVMVYTAGN